jgi:hypothetical protein
MEILNQSFAANKWKNICETNKKLPLGSGNYTFEEYRGSAYTVSESKRP